MNIFRKKSFYLASLLTILPIFAGLVIYNKLPDMVAIHYDVAFKPDGYGPKALAVFGLPFFMLILNTVVWFAICNDPKQDNISSRIKKISLWFIPVFSNVIQFFLLASNLNADLNIIQFLPIVVGVVFIIIGNYLPKTRVNYTVGIRTPWALNDPENWRKTNRLGGYLMVLSGIIIIIFSFIPVIAFWAFLLTLIPLIIIPYGYSYYLYKQGI